MNRDDPTEISMFDCLTFPTTGGVPLSAAVTVGFFSRPSFKTATEKRQQHRDAGTMCSDSIRLRRRGSNVSQGNRNQIDDVHLVRSATIMES